MMCYHSEYDGESAAAGVKKLIPFDQYIEDERRKVEEERKRAEEEAKLRPRVQFSFPPNIENPSGLACMHCGAELTEVIPGTSGSLTLWEAYFECRACGKHHGRGPQTTNRYYKDLRELLGLA